MSRPSTRRSFLALIASAPIAALAPLPKILANPDLDFAKRFISYYEPAVVSNAGNPGEWFITSGGEGYVFGKPRWGTAQPDYPIRIS